MPNFNGGLVKSPLKLRPVASFTKEVNPRLAKRLLKTNGRLANRGLTSLVKEATAGVITSHIKPRVWLLSHGLISAKPKILT